MPAGIECGDGLGVAGDVEERLDFGGERLVLGRLVALGELLYRSARTRASVREGLPSKPYPSGGSLYELEVYPIVRVADGLAPGMYHYDSVANTLEPVADIDDSEPGAVPPALRSV